MFKYAFYFLTTFIATDSFVDRMSIEEPYKPYWDTTRVSGNNYSLSIKNLIEYDTLITKSSEIILKGILWENSVGGKRLGFSNILIRSIETDSIISGSHTNFAGEFFIKTDTSSYEKTRIECYYQDFIPQSISLKSFLTQTENGKKALHLSLGSKETLLRKEKLFYTLQDKNVEEFEPGSIMKINVKLILENGKEIQYRPKPKLKSQETELNNIQYNFSDNNNFNFELCSNILNNNNITFIFHPNKNEKSNGVFSFNVYSDTTLIIELSNKIDLLSISYYPKCIDGLNNYQLIERVDRRKYLYRHCDGTIRSYQSLIDEGLPLNFWERIK